MAVNKISTTANQKALGQKDVSQVVNQNVKKRKKRKVVFILLLLLFLLLVAGTCFFAFFLVRRNADTKNVVMDLKVSAYTVSNDGEEETPLFDKPDTFAFREDDEDLNSHTTDIEGNLTKNTYIRIDYKIDNLSSHRYNYTINLDQVSWQNCNISYYTDENPTPVPLNAEKFIVLDSDSDLVISIVIRLGQDTHADAFCQGSIVFKITAQ